MLPIPCHLLLSPFLFFTVWRPGAPEGSETWDLLLHPTSVTENPQKPERGAGTSLSEPGNKRKFMVDTWVKINQGYHQDPNRPSVNHIPWHLPGNILTVFCFPQIPSKFHWEKEFFLSSCFALTCLSPFPDTGPATSE